MGTRTLVRIVVLNCILALFATGVSAQELPGRAVSAHPGAPVTLAVSQPGSHSTYSEVISGKGTVGPYTLAWKPINQFSEQVMIDNRMVQRDFDYTINYTTGIITFNESVGSKAIIRVEYSYNPSQAARNAAPLSIPLSLDILKKGDTGLQLTGLYKQNDPNNKASSDLAVLGLTGNTKNKTGSLDSMFLFSPLRPDQDSAESSFDDRSAMKLGSSMKSGMLQLNANYLHVGEDFGAAKDYSLQQGLDTMNMALALTPSQALNFSSSFNRTENLIGEKQGEVNTVTAHTMVVTPNGAPKLTVSRTEVGKEKPGTAEQSVTTDTMRLEHTFNPKVSAIASHEAVDTNVGGSETSVTTNQLALSTKPLDNLAVQSSLTQTDSSVDGKQTGMNLVVNAAPMKSLSVNAAMNRLDSEKTGDTNTETLSLVSNPNSRLSVLMNLAHKDADLTGNEFAHDIKIVSNPLNALRLEMGMVGRDVEQNADEASRTARLSTTALRNTTVQLDWAQRESDLKGDEEMNAVRVETSPLKMVKLSGALGQRDTTDRHEVSKEARMEVSPFSHTKLGGGYTEVEANGGFVTRTTELNASTKPVSAFELTGTYKSRVAAGQSSLNTLNASVVLDTGRIFSVTGAYSENPEDNKGVIQRLNAQTIGLKSDLGRLRLKGAFTLKDEYLASRQSRTTEVGFDYKLSANSRIGTKYSIDEYKQASLLEASVYSLEYIHRVGSRLNLYIGGSMKTYEQDQTMLEDQTEYQGEARFGVKF